MDDTGIDFAMDMSAMNSFPSTNNANEAQQMDDTGIIVETDIFAKEHTIEVIESASYSKNDESINKVSCTFCHCFSWFSL